MDPRLRALAGVPKAQVYLGNGADGLAEQGVAVLGEGLGEDGDGPGRLPGQQDARRIAAKEMDVALDLFAQRPSIRRTQP
ncbi:hypothetical protein MGU_07048 [Metarhizium guizhouense ARSEF 977]|uniref:Uncharacterized protein n=1 Tax=Metarhizium guizhouense (strain ARSEF 977) TaxID=1276136 RepID=A0A0B4GFB8_METGA|nr:hypothetical protein MGU_07048 [Metarhizium guizhouense ARSEF 977]